MKKKTKQTPAAAPHITDKDIESTAIDLDHLAKSKLPDGCLSGVLTGYEPDIRQQAVLIAMQWWLERHTGAPGDWVAKKSISYALRFAKLRHLEQIERRAEYPYDDQTDRRITEHPYSLHEQNYPEHSLLLMFEQILAKCLKHGSISKSNAVIARMVYIEGKTIKEVADTLGRHTSAIAQQLSRVRSAVIETAKTTDPTFAQ